MMIKALTTNDERAWKNWVNRNGGDKTLKSYGFNENEFTGPENEEFIKLELHSYDDKKLS